MSGMMNYNASIQSYGANLSSAQSYLDNYDSGFYDSYNKKFASAKERAKEKTTEAIRSNLQSVGLFNDDLQAKAQQIHDKGMAAIELGVATEASVVGVKALVAGGRALGKKLATRSATKLAADKADQEGFDAYLKKGDDADMPSTPTAPDDDPVVATEEEPVVATEEAPVTATSEAPVTATSELDDAFGKPMTDEMNTAGRGGIEGGGDAEASATEEASTAGETITSDDAGNVLSSATADVGEEVATTGADAVLAPATELATGAVVDLAVDTSAMGAGLAIGAVVAEAIPVLGGLAMLGIGAYEIFGKHKHAAPEQAASIASMTVAPAGVPKPSLPPPPHQTLVQKGEMVVPSFDSVIDTPASNSAF
jgi:hypothetical protein